MSNDTNVVIKLPEEVIKAQVQAAVVAALSKDPDKLIAAMVKASMEVKSNSYDRESMFEKMMREMVHQEAIASFKQWLDEMRPAIRAQIVEKLSTRKKEQVAKMADKLLTSLEKASFSVHVSDSD